MSLEEGEKRDSSDDDNDKSSDETDADSDASSGRNPGHEGTTRPPPDPDRTVRGEEGYCPDYGRVLTDPDEYDFCTIINIPLPIPVEVIKYELGKHECCCGNEIIASQGATDALHHENSRTGLVAKLSMRYAVASALVRDTVGLATFEDAAIDDSEVDSVRKQVAFDIDPMLAYDSHEATVRIETNRGIFDVTRYDPPGTHDHPPTESELRQKFFECAQPSLSPVSRRTSTHPSSHSAM
jgi:hypothetical protein